MSDDVFSQEIFNVDEILQSPKVSSPEFEEQVNLLRQLQQEAWTLKAEHIKWPGTILNEAIGPWDEGICFITAVENTGKSSFIVQTIVETLKKNEDVCVLDVSLDDSFRERTRRYAGVIAGIPTDKIARPVKADEREVKRREYAYNVIAGWLAQGRLQVKTHAEHEFSNHFRITDAIRKFHAANPDKKLILIVDAFHDLLMPEVKSDEPEKFVLQDLSKALKECGAIAIMTAHRRKPPTSVVFSRRSSNDELKGSAYIKHYAKIMMVLHNEVKANRDSAEMFWCTADEPNKRLPILEVSIQKNKTCDWDGWIFYKFLPSTGQAQEIVGAEADACRAIAIASLQRRTYSHSNT